MAVAPSSHVRDALHFHPEIGYTFMFLRSGGGLIVQLLALRMTVDETRRALPTVPQAHVVSHDQERR